MKKFNAHKIIETHVNDVELQAYYVGFDINTEGEHEYRMQSLVKLLLEVIPEFAFGYHKGISTNNTELVSLVKEAAKSIYSIKEFNDVKGICDNGECIDDDVEDKYLRRGEFGELILHLFMREFNDTIPLISKIYFKDSYGATVHGFDAVHIHEESKSLWLGESKLYLSGKKGVNALISDIKEHIQTNYLENEFAILSKKIYSLDNISEKEYWLDLLNNSTKLSEQLDSITIPLLCTYESPVFLNHNDVTKKFIDDLEEEINELNEHFKRNNNHKLKDKIKVVLILFPIKSKKELVSKLHNNLSVFQLVGEL